MVLNLHDVALTIAAVPLCLLLPSRTEPAAPADDKARQISEKTSPATQ
ncbi:MULTISPECIES: hypothetical protein [unclassified Streptomyces]